MNASSVKIVIFAVFISVLLSFALFTVLSQSSGGMAGPSEGKVEQIVAKFIKENPEAILESVTTYQRNMQEQQVKRDEEAVQQNRSEVEDSKNQPFIGNPNGTVVVTEFFDYACGYCKRMLGDINRLRDEHPNVKIVFREYPILGENSYVATQASLAVYKIATDQYFDFHQKLMKTRITGKESVLAIASELGVDPIQLEEKMNSKEITDHIDENRRLAATLGIRGTPAFIINGQLYPGALDYDTLSQQVKNAK